MSKIIVGWQLTGGVEDRDVRRRIGQIKARYQPLFQETIEHTGFWRQGQGLLHFDVPQPDDRGLWVGAESLICVTGRPSITADASPLYGAPLTAKVLHDHLFGSTAQVDRRVLHHINPPFTLCRFDKNNHMLNVVHDGLGADQFFIAATGRGIIFSNKCWPILLFLGESPRIDLDAWRYWFCLGWFPESATPFENVRSLARGEIIRADSHTVAFDSEDTFRSWILPSGDRHSTPALVARASDSVRQIIRSNRTAGARYSSDLTGGLDSRAICSVLIKEGIPCIFYTGGSRHSGDVILARRIAKRFNLEWHHVAEPGFGRRDHSATRMDVQFKRLLLWGEGLVEPNRFEHFRRESCPTEHGAYLSGGSSEISKGHYYANLLRKEHELPSDLHAALTGLEGRIGQLLRDADSFNVRQRLRDQIALGELYGIGGLTLLDFFYLNERVRRWQSAHLAVNLFDRTVLPFVNVEHIQLAFAMRPADKAERRLQTFIIAQNAEELLRVGFADSVPVTLWAFLWRAILKHRRLAALMKTYSWADYLRGDGRVVVDTVLSTQSVLWQILDRNKARARWNEFIRGSNQEFHFLLGLVAFRQWYAMYAEPPLGDRSHDAPPRISS